MKMHLADADDVRRLRERLVDVAVLIDTVPGAVRGRGIVHDDLVLQGLFGVDDRVEHVVVDVDEQPRIHRDRGSLRGDGRDRLPW